MPDNHSRGVRHTRADEEPDVDDIDMAYADGCTRCGHDDHADDECPVVVPHLLRPIEDRTRGRRR